MDLLKGLTVSCQAVEGEPLYGYNVMGIMAKAAVAGGATAIRTSGINDICEIRKNVDVPIIGLIKKCYDDSPIYITPTVNEVAVLANSPCEVIAIDATFRKRPYDQQLVELVEYVKKNAPGKFLMADVATTEEAINAEKLGFDVVSTTLRGYTENTMDVQIPDYDMISKTIRAVKIPVIAEGGIWEIAQLEKILTLGIHGVVIGTSITRPKDITARFKKCFTE